MSDPGISVVVRPLSGEAPSPAGKTADPNSIPYDAAYRMPNDGSKVMRPYRLLEMTVTASDVRTHVR